MRYYALEKLINLHDNYRKVFKIDHYNLLLVQWQSALYLIESHCPHRGYAMSEADIDGMELRCPLHGYRFSIDSGELIYASEERCRGLKTYELVYRQRDVGVMLD